ncbi:MAG: D-glycero-beta-D-manno-heptose 1,7-bisphosphate 7-phosphatase [Deltaproteobacteria bacterium]|jgi:D-glycero-D-manno-heptose 1,7-bisphosphate phosphatase|nr:D-glycero-beta-D-manno-heptose 1,7-bisphosphate 7-phosphatase [Deltaproteobacteria bacterium]
MTESTKTQRSAVFLDRDGTLNHDKGFVYLFKDFIWIEDVTESLARLKKAGLVLVVITNQSGVNRKFYTHLDVQTLHQEIERDLLARHSITIDGWYYCPHNPEKETCSCRKPSPGLILKAAEDLNLDLTRSYMVGDKLLDIEAGLKAGVKKTIMVRTGYGLSEQKKAPAETIVVDAFPRAADYILQDLAWPT